MLMRHSVSKCWCNIQNDVNATQCEQMLIQHTNVDEGYTMQDRCHQNHEACSIHCSDPAIWFIIGRNHNCLTSTHLSSLSWSPNQMPKNQAESKGKYQPWTKSDFIYYRSGIFACLHIRELFCDFGTFCEV